MRSTLNTAKNEKPSWFSILGAKLSRRTASDAEEEAQTAIIAKGAQRSFLMKTPGWLFATNAMKKFTQKNKNGQGRKAICSTLLQKKKFSQSPKKTEEKKVNKPKIVEPVKFKIAGAEMTINPDFKISGDFHKISFELWQAIIGFHRQISINLDAESVSYHKWNENLKEYITIIPWQTSSKHGLHVDVKWTDPRNQELLDEYGKRFGEEFFPACTIHTHVDTSAFESGTDAKDEEHNPGWHITLGKLISSKEAYDFDFRMRLPQTKKLKEIVDTGSKIKLVIQHLIPGDKEARDKYTGIPGTTDFHHLLNRVETK